MNNIEIDLQIACKHKPIPSVEDFQRWVEAALVAEEDGVHYEVCIRVVNAKESQKLNHQFRQKNKPTNVLSFGYGDEGLPLLGDLVICAEVVSHEAQAQNKPELAHWAHLTIHGLLHLQGFDHEKPDDAEKMESKEIAILEKLGIENPYRGDNA